MPTTAARPRRLPRSVRPGDLLRGLADAGSPGSFSNSRRSRRFARFERLVEDLKLGRSDPVRILDIGGTNAFWQNRGWADREDVHVVLVNLEAEQPAHPNIDPQA